DAVERRRLLARGGAAGRSLEGVAERAGRLASVPQDDEERSRARNQGLDLRQAPFAELGVEPPRGRVRVGERNLREGAKQSAITDPSPRTLAAHPRIFPFSG